jgi:hypothetical protein
MSRGGSVIELESRRTAETVPTGDKEEMVALHAQRCKSDSRVKKWLALTLAAERMW